MADPFDIMAMDEVRDRSKCDIEPMVAATKDIEQAIANITAWPARSKRWSAQDRPSRRRRARSLNTPLEEAPVTKLVNLLVMRAVEERASDVHIEPTAKTSGSATASMGSCSDISHTPLHLYRRS